MTYHRTLEEGDPPGNSVQEEDVNENKKVGECQVGPRRKECEGGGGHQSEMLQRSHGTEGCDHQEMTGDQIATPGEWEERLAYTKV